MTLLIKFYGVSDRGLVRRKNEDNWVADSEQGLYIVSDGMGGEAAGALASEIVVKTLPALLKKKMPHIKELTDPNTSQQLLTAIAELSDSVQREAMDVPGLAGMGATVVVALIQDSHALIGHMGDSRAYLLRAESLRQLTKDHSIVQLLMDQGEITSEEALQHPARGQLTRAVGMDGTPLPEAHSIELRTGDKLLLCTDGLNGMLKDEQILSILNNHHLPEKICRELIATANKAGGKDNITAVVLSIDAGIEE